MKKLLLSMIAFAIVSASFAHTDVFQKNKNRNTSRQLSIKKHNDFKFVPQAKASNINVAQLIKESWWDEGTNNWYPIVATRYNYANNRLESELKLSYTLTDTLAKIEYTYDANGRYSTVTNKSFDLNTHTFVNVNRQTITYSANDSYFSLFENYDQMSNTWSPYNRSTTIFDAKGNLISSKGEYYDGGLWTLSFAYSRYISYYNNTVKIVTEIDSSYSDMANMMIAEYKSEKDYDANGRAIKITNSIYENNVENIDEIDSIFYDANGIPTTLIAFTELLEPMAKLTNISWGGNYNPNIDLFNNQPLGYETYGALNGTWILIGRTSTIFPDNNGSTIHLEEDYEDNAYIPTFRYNELFDNNKNQIERSEESYDTTNNVWITRYGIKDQYQYDMNNNMFEDITLEFSTFDSLYHKSYKHEYSDYISIVAGLNNIKTIETKLFPNPSTNGKVNIDLNLEKSSSISIEVIDINGRIVNVQHEDLGQGLNTIELNGLNKGLYFVVITSDFGVSRTKLMVK